MKLLVEIEKQQQNNNINNGNDNKVRSHNEKSGFEVILGRASSFEMEESNLDRLTTTTTTTITIMTMSEEEKETINLDYVRVMDDSERKGQ